MQKINRLSPFLSSNEANEIELKKHSQKNISLDKDKIYFFRTSLFSEKSKNFIQRMNSSHKKLVKNNIAIIAPKINQDQRQSRQSLHEKKEKVEKIAKKLVEKVELPEEKPKIKKKEYNTIDNNNEKKDISVDKKYINIKIRKDVNNKSVNYRYNSSMNINNELSSIAKKQSNTSKSTNNLMNINTNNKNNCLVKIDNKSKTENKMKKENNINNENGQKINYKIFENMKKCKLFSSITSQIDNINNINRNINSRSILGNYACKSKSIVNNPLPNTSLKPKQLSQKKDLKISYYNKKIIKYKLKSIKNPNKENNNISNNNLIVSPKSICDNNTMKKEMKYYKSISKHSNIQSLSIFNENYHITRYKLWNYLGKKNNKYRNKNRMSEDRIDQRKYMKNGMYQNNFY